MPGRGAGRREGPFLIISCGTLHGVTHFLAERKNISTSNLFSYFVLVLACVSISILHL